MKVRLDGVLETTYVTGTVSVTQGTNPWHISASALPLPSGSLTENAFTARFGVVTGSPFSSSSANGTMYTPQSGKKIRLKWLGMATPESNLLPTIVTIKLGATEIYKWPLGTPGAFSHGSVREGSTDAPLIMSQSAGQQIYFNFDIEEVT